MCIKKITDRFSRGNLPLTRIEAFSDGVFAIIVTLLVLDLKIPELHEPKNVAELCQSLLELAPKFFSWLISFIIVCKFWLNHHHILKLAKNATYGMVWLNSIFLMFQSFVPFPTALMGQYPGNALAVSFFGVVMAFNTLLFIALHAYILHNVMKPEQASNQLPHIICKSFIGPVFYLLGAGAAWLSIPAAFILYIITPLFFIIPPSKNE